MSGSQIKTTDQSRVASGDGETFELMQTLASRDDWLVFSFSAPHSLSLLISRSLSQFLSLSHSLYFSLYRSLSQTLSFQWNFCKFTFIGLDFAVDSKVK